MLLDNQDNFEKDYDFEEINSKYNALHDFHSTADSDKKVENDEVLPFKAKIAVFLSGFAYIGLLAISFTVALIVSSIVSDSSLRNVLIQSLTYIILFGVIFGICFKYKDKIIPILKDKKGYLMGLAMGAATFGVELIVSNFMYSIFPVETNTNEVVIESLIVNYPTIMFLIAVIIGPFCEEMTYRVALCGMLKKAGTAVSIIVSSLIFGFIHLSFSNTTLAAELVSFPVYFAIGAMLAFSYKKWGFTCSFVAHSVINFIAFGLTLLTANLL